MHGFNHLYKTETKNRDYFNYGGKSEFYICHLKRNSK